MEAKNIQIEKFIIEQLQMRNIPEKYTEVIKDNYSNDSRDLETIKKEIRLLISKLSITQTEKRKQEFQKSVNSESQILNNANQQEATQSSTIFKTDNTSSQKENKNVSTFDNLASVKKGQGQNVSPTRVNSQKVSIGEELNSMFDFNGPPNESQNTASISQNNSKGKTYVKSNGKSILYNDNGFSSLMNISFILTTITILGIFLATIIILINKA